MSCNCIALIQAELQQLDDIFVPVCRVQHGFHLDRHATCLLGGSQGGHHVSKSVSTGGGRKAGVAHAVHRHVDLVQVCVSQSGQPARPVLTLLVVNETAGRRCRLVVAATISL